MKDLDSFVKLTKISNFSYSTTFVEHRNSDYSYYNKVYPNIPNPNYKEFLYVK